MRLGEALKERGQQIALFHAGRWQDDAMEALKAFARTREEFTAEQFRYDWLNSGGYEPPTHKAWGALVTAARAAGHIEHTGRYVRAQSAKTRAHPVSVWLGKGV